MWSKIIKAKIWLKDILPEVKRMLYLDSDMINVAPISDIWKFNVTGKTLAGTKRIHGTNL